MTGHMDMHIIVMIFACFSNICCFLHTVPEQTGRTVLHYTASEGHISTMRTLVKEFKINPDVVDNVGAICMSAPVYVLYIVLLHDEAIHQRREVCNIKSNAHFGVY